jgi:hypothetical protein
LFYVPLQAFSKVHVIIWKYHQDLFLRAGEYLLDEQLILGQNVKIRIFQQLRTTFCSLFRILSQKKEKEEVVSNVYEVWISNDLRCAESNLYQFGFLKVHVRQSQLLTSIGQNILKEWVIYEKLLTGEHMDNKIHW